MIAEAASALVSVEQIGTVIGDIEISIAIVVDVADGDAGAPTGIIDASGAADFSKAALALVVEQGIARARLGLIRRQCGAVDGVEVEAAIVVIVEERRSTTMGFKDILFFGTAEGVMKVDACRNRLVRKAGLGGSGGDQQCQGTDDP